MTTRAALMIPLLSVMYSGLAAVISSYGTVLGCRRGRREEKKEESGGHWTLRKGKPGSLASYGYVMCSSPVLAV